MGVFKHIYGTNKCPSFQRATQNKASGLDRQPVTQACSSVYIHAEKLEVRGAPVLGVLSSSGYLCSRSLS